MLLSSSCNVNNMFLVFWYAPPSIADPSHAGTGQDWVGFFFRFTHLNLVTSSVHIHLRTRCPSSNYNQQEDPGLDSIAYMQASSATWVTLEHPREPHAATSEDLSWNGAGHVCMGHEWVTDYRVSLNTYLMYRCLQCRHIIYIIYI